MPFHSGNLPLYDFHGNLQNDLPFLEEMGSQEYRSWGGGMAPACAQWCCGRRKIHSAPLRSKLMQMFI